MKLEIYKYDIQIREYKNAITYKFDNRRVTVIKLKDGWGFEFKIMNKKREKTCCYSENVHGCQISTIRLSKEAGEVIMLALAEQMNLKVSYEVK